MDMAEGKRIVELKVLGKNLRCRHCNCVFCLDDITHEKRVGLHSVLTVKCEKCKTQTKVNTGIIENNTSHINASIVHGAVHSGTGSTALNKILACADIPSISNEICKKYEKIVGKAIEDEAKSSCKRAAEEEKHLVLKHIKELCDELPSNIFEDIFPHLANLNPSSPDDATNAQSNNNAAFNSAFGQVINIIVSYDTGWSIHGNGKSYDSLNGYSTIIGFLSGKVLDYATRNRKCKKCELSHEKTDHDCPLNFQGSAKAMEADTGVELINHSNVLKESGLQVRVIVGDDDSSMIASVRKDKPEINFHKLSDKNHLTKTFSNVLYKMANTHKQLKRKGVIHHLKKCFSYAIAQNKGNSENLAKNLKQIPDHLYNLHENCGTWCKRKEKHSVQLLDAALQNELVQFFSKYADNAHKFSVAASSQGNESFNNIVCHKAPKSICLSRSAACDYRVADSICVKNDGEKSLLNVQTAVGLPLGKFTSQFASAADRKRKARKEKSQQKFSKLRRLELKQSREILRKNKEKIEGLTCQRNCVINAEISLIDKTCDIAINVDLNIIYFDLETTGLNNDADIVQIAAKSNNCTFNIYVNPSKEISCSASNVTGIYKINDALNAFHRFLHTFPENKRILLVAHNAAFDTRILLRHIINNDMLHNFNNMIVGFSDSLKMFKTLIVERKGSGQFKLETLATNYLQPDQLENFHDACSDVSILEKLVISFNYEKRLTEFSKTFRESYISLLENNSINFNMQFLTKLISILSIGILKKLALNKITYEAVSQIQI